MPASNPMPVDPIPLRLARWVVGFDGSASSEHTLAWAAAHAPGRTRCIDIVTAWHAALSTSRSASAVTVADANEAMRQAAEADAAQGAAFVNRLLDQHRDHQIDVATACIHGGASAVLLDRAEAADLLIVGNRGRGGFSRLLLGSTSNQCATHAVTPTIVVRERSDRDVHVPTTKIVVGIDGSDNSVAALDWAIDFADAGTEVTAVWAWDVSPLAVGADQFFFPEASDLARGSFDRLVDDHRKAAAVANVSLASAFVEGPPRSSLIEAGSAADLVVVGARGHGTIGSVLLGSVSSWLVHHADRPVAIVPSR